MNGKWLQHVDNHQLGDNQLIHGLPKHMAASANLSSANTSSSNATSGGEVKTYWKYNPSPQACDKCKAMEGLWFEEYPGPVHPNCRCDIVQFEAIKVTGRSDDGIVVPPGVDIEANLREARQVARECEREAREYIEPMSMLTIDALSFGLKCSWIYENFNTGKRYDFKQLGPQYEDFGNYHYGMYTKAMGISATFAQVAAGYAQIRSETSDWGFWDTYFDDPRDNEMIRKGRKYPIK